MKDALQSIAPCTEEEYVSRPFSDVPDEEITWLFQDRIAFGMVSIVVGYPGAGKSSMLIDLMSRASTTGEMPDGTVLPGPINCIYLCTEAGKRSAIKGMLKKANADTDRVFYIEENYLTLSDAKIRKAVHERKAKLLVIDPIQQYFDEDMNHAQSARRQMSELGILAAQEDCAIVLVGHFTKDAPVKDLYHGMGSADIYAFARSVLHVVDFDGKSSLRYLKTVKSNNTQPGASFWYEIVDPGIVKWIGPNEPEKAEQLMAEAGKAPSPKLNYAAEMLEEILCSRDLVPFSVVQKYMLEKGISEATYRRAKKEIGARSVKRGDSWYLQTPL